jgi:hypothetical protein
MALPFNLNPEMLSAISQGLLSGRTGSEQLGNAMTGALQAKQGMQQRNKTLEFLAQSPEISQMVEAGVLSPQDGLKAFLTQQAETRKAQMPNRKFQTLADGTYGFADENAGTFTPMGKATKPNDAANTYAEREAAAARYGLTPDSPAYQSFVLSGKMPREDQSPLTATDKKAIFEADEMVQASQAAIPLLQKAMELNDKAYSGFAAGTRGAITGALGSEAGQATQELDNVVTTQALGQMKAIFGGNPTEGERAILLDVAGSSNSPPEVRKGIYQRAMQAVQRRLEFYQQRANEMRGGTYFKPGGQPQQGGNRTSTGTTWKVVE